MGGNVLKGLKPILVARTIELDIIVYQIVPIILRAADRTEKKAMHPI